MTEATAKRRTLPYLALDKIKARTTAELAASTYVPSGTRAVLDQIIAKNEVGIASGGGAREIDERTRAIQARGEQ